MIQERFDRLKQIRLEAWRILTGAGIGDETLGQLEAIGLSEEEARQIRFEFIEGPLSPSSLAGKITELPKLDPDHKGGLLGGILPTLAQSYVGWAVFDHETEPEQSKLSYWVNFWSHPLGNTPEETRKLFVWMQENPFEVADYLDRIWLPEFSKMWTEPFRDKAQSGDLPKLILEE